MRLLDAHIALWAVSTERPSDSDFANCPGLRVLNV